MAQYHSRQDTSHKSVYAYWKRYVAYIFVLSVLCIGIFFPCQTQHILYRITHIQFFHSCTQNSLFSLFSQPRSLLQNTVVVPSQTPYINQAYDVEHAETVTHLYDNSDGSFTHTNENGTHTTWRETTTILTEKNTAHAQKEIATYTNENGIVRSIRETVTTFSNIIDSARGHLIASFTNEQGVVHHIYETVTGWGNLQSNGKTIATVTREDGSTVDIKETVTTMVVKPLQQQVIYTNEIGATTTIDFPSLETLTLFTNALTGPHTHLIGTYQNEDGVIANIYETTTRISSDTTNQTISFIDEKGITTTLSVRDLETTTVLVNNSDGSFTYTDEEGVNTTWTETLTTLVDNGNGSFTYINEDGVATTWQETLTTLADVQITGKIIGTHTNENGTTTAIRETITTVIDTQSTGHVIARHTREDGVTSTIKETVTSLRENADGTFTFTHEDGTETTIHIQNLETTTVVTIGSDGHSIDYIDEDGTITNIDIKALETTTQLTYDATAQTFTYTNEDGNITTVPITDLETTTTVVDTNTAIIKKEIAQYTNENGLVASLYETVTNLTNTLIGSNIQRIGSFINEQGTITNFYETVTRWTNTQATGNIIGTFSREDGTTTDIKETITTLVDNIDGTYTYTREDGATTTITDTLRTLTCAADEVPQWNGFTWTCANVTTCGPDSSYFCQSGNIFNTEALLGTQDAYGLTFLTNNAQVGRFDTQGNFLGNNSNVINGATSSIVFGDTNVLDTGGKPGYIFGYGNSLNGSSEFSTAFGAENKNKNGVFNFFFGAGNSNEDGQHNIFFGEKNTHIGNGSFNYLFGVDNKTDKDLTLVFGKGVDATGIYESFILGAGGINTNLSLNGSDSYINVLGGNVGVGTTTPTSLLSVGNTSQFQVNNQGDILRIHDIPYTWPTTQGLSNTYLRNDGTGTLSWIPLSMPMSSLTSAVATNTINNTAFTQTWNWTGLGTGTGLAIVSDSNTSTGGVMRIANTSATGVGTVFQVQANSTANTGLTVLANGNIGMGTNAPVATLHNAGSTVFDAKTISNLSTGGPVGTAINTVDISTVLNIGQTTANQTLSLPTPSNTTAGRIIYLNNTGTVSFLVAGSHIAPGTGRTFMWNGIAWSALFDNPGSGTQIKTKATNQTVTNSTTLVNDSDLSFAIGANQTWVFEYVLQIHNNNSATPDWKAAIRGPAGSTCNVTQSGEEPNGNPFPQAQTTNCTTPSTLVNNTILASTTPFQVYINGVITSGATAGTVNLQFAENTAGAGTSISILAGSLMRAYNVAGADLAEVYYTKDQSIDEGTIVSLSGTGVSQVIKTHNGTAAALGIVSTKPGIIIGEADGFGKPVVVGLAGRVPLKVSTENGGIQPGDYIAPSHIAGVGVRATEPGYIVGQALTGYDGETEGTIMVFIKNTYFAGIPHIGTPSATISKDITTSFTQDINVPPLVTWAQNIITFIHDIIVNNIHIDGTITVTHPDTAGVVVVSTGQTAQRVSFASTHETTPLIQLTAQGHFVYGSIFDADKTGFTVKIPDAQETDTVFAWMAIYKSHNTPTPSAISPTVTPVITLETITPPVSTPSSMLSPTSSPALFPTVTPAIEIPSMTITPSTQTTPTPDTPLHINPTE